MADNMAVPVRRVADPDTEVASVGRVTAWTYALAPALLFVLTWGGDFSFLQRRARTYALPVLAVEIAIIAFSFRQGWRLGKPPLLPLVVTSALAALVWATAIAAPVPASALMRTGIWTIHVLFALAIINQGKHGMLDSDETARAILVGFLVFCALLLVFVASYPQSPIERVHDLPAFSHVRWVSYYCVAAVGLAAAGFLRANKLALAAATIAFAVVFWTGARGGIVATTGGFIVSAVLFRDFRSSGVWVRFVGCALAGLALSSAVSLLVPFEGQGLDVMARLDSTGRINLWKLTIEQIKLRPWLGWGEGQFSHLVDHQFVRSHHFVHPHEVVLQVLLAWGVVGALLCAALAIWVAPRIFDARNEKARPFQFCALSLLAYSLFDGALFQVQSVSLFALSCAVAIAINPEEVRGRTLR